jgi:hypothetical protein
MSQTLCPVLNMLTPSFSEVEQSSGNCYMIVENRCICYGLILKNKKYFFSFLASLIWILTKFAILAIQLATHYMLCRKKQYNSICSSSSLDRLYSIICLYFLRKRGDLKSPFFFYCEDDNLASFILFIYIFESI